MQARKVRMIILTAVITNSLQARVIYRDTLTVYPFDPVVVTGTRSAVERHELPVALSFIPVATTTANAQNSLLETISASVPGLFVTQRTNVGFGVASGSAGNVTLRGLGAFPNTQVLVLIDGRPDVMGLFGHPLSDVYTLQNVQRVEVIRGPASLIYGSNAMGGAINVVTKRESLPGWHGQVSLNYGSFNTRQLNFQQSFDRERLFWCLTGGYHASDGFRKVGRDDYVNLNGNFSMRYRFRPDFYLDANAYLSNLDLYDPGQLSNPFNDHHFDIKRRGGDLTIEKKLNQVTTQVKFHHNQGHHLIHDPGFYESYDYTSGIIAAATYQSSSGGRYLCSGDLRQYGGRAFLNSQWNKQTVREYSALVQANQKLGRILVIDGGVRLTKHSYTDLIWVPALGTVINLPDRLFIRAQYSTGYRVPTINELFLFSPSNTEIKNEYTRNWELSIDKSFSRRLSLTAGIYYNRASNLIEKNPVQINGQTRRLYQNTGLVQIKGLELEGHLIPGSDILINWSYALTKTSRKLAGTPEQKAGITLLVKSISKLTLELEGEWVNGLYAITNPYSSGAPVYGRLAGYLTFDCRTTWQIGHHLDLQLELNNLTDAQYLTVWDFPLPGRHYSVGLHFKI